MFLLHQTARESPLLALLDLSAAFDCVDHDILLQSSFALAGKVLDWLRSFMTGRSQQVLRDGCFSELMMILFGVTQGSVIGPILFILYMVEQRRRKQIESGGGGHCIQQGGHKDGQS